MSSILAWGGGVSTQHSLSPPLAVAHLPHSCTGLAQVIYRFFYLLDLALDDLPGHVQAAFYWVWMLSSVSLRPT